MADATLIEEEPRVDVHMPKPWHGFRGFLKEYLIIVVGVLTALGGQQVVETLNTRAQIREARKALDAELGFDLSAFNLIVQQKACAERRLDELTRWAAAMETGRPLPLKGPIGRPSNVVFRTSVWTTAASGAVAQMPFEDRIKYGQFYDGIENNGANRQRAGEAWDDLSKYVPARRLNQEQLLEVRHDIERLKRFYTTLDGNAAQIQRYAERLSVKPVPLSQSEGRDQRIAELCRPVLADTSGP